MTEDWTWNTLCGKTIHSVTRMKKPEYDDRGWVRFTFTDGTSAYIIAGYDGYTGKSADEYPTWLDITSTSIRGLVEDIAP